MVNTIEVYRKMEIVRLPLITINLGLFLGGLIQEHPGPSRG